MLRHAEFGCLASLDVLSDSCSERALRADEVLQVDTEQLIGSGDGYGDGDGYGYGYGYGSGSGDGDGYGYGYGDGYGDGYGYGYGDGYGDGSGDGDGNVSTICADGAWEGWGVA